MSYYYQLRGWLQVPFDRFQAVTTHLKELQENAEGTTKAYLGGWHPAYTEINTTAYLFYGADVKAEGVDLLISVVQALIGLEIWDQESLIDGYFHADGEDNRSNYVIKIIDGELRWNEDHPLLNFSDKLYSEPS